MYTGKVIFSQVMDCLPLHTLDYFLKSDYK